MVNDNAATPGATTISKYDPAVPTFPCVLEETPAIVSPSARGCPTLLASEVSNLYVLSSVNVTLCPSTPLIKNLLTFVLAISSVPAAPEVPPVIVSTPQSTNVPVTPLK